MRLDGGGGADTRRSGQPYHTGCQAGGPSSLGPGFLLEGKQDRLPFCQATTLGDFISESASKLPYPLPKERFETQSGFYLKLAGVSLSFSVFLESWLLALQGQAPSSL